MTHRGVRSFLALPRVAFVLAVLTAVQPAHGQPAARERQLQAGVRVQVFVDQRRNATAKRTIDGGGDFQGYAYRMRPNAQHLDLRLDSDEIMRRWKGDFVLGQPTKDKFESETQFIPVLLVVDVSNEGGAPAQVASSYLAVESSVTDRQPFINLSNFGDLDNSESEASHHFDLRNHGWGRAENAQLEFAFGRDRPASESFRLALGPLGAVEVNPIRAMTAISPAVPKLQRQPPRCPSEAMVRHCLQQLAQVAPLGRLADIAYLRGNVVLTKMFGKLSYQWRDNANAMHRREHIVVNEIAVFKFDTGVVPEGGAPAPEEAGFRPITLPLDRAQYRMALPYRPRVGPGENRRFELTLNAAKSSQHMFRVVMELTNGTRAVSAPIELQYFTPQMDVGETRQVQ